MGIRTPIYSGRTDNRAAHGGLETGLDWRRREGVHRGKWRVTGDRGQIGYRMQEINRRNTLGAVAGINHEQKERREGETYRVGAFTSFVVHWVQNLKSINQYGGQSICRGEIQKRKERRRGWLVVGQKLRVDNRIGYRE